jgi:hypothetical protein
MSARVATDALHTTSHYSAGTMSHAVVLDALRIAPPPKPHPPWLEQLQAQWQATKHAFESIRASDSGVASTNAALHETKTALLAVVGLLPHKHRTELDDSWLKKFLGSSLSRSANIILTI